MRIITFKQIPSFLLICARCVELKTVEMIGLFLLFGGIALGSLIEDNSTLFCDGEEISQKNFTFCSTDALGLSLGVLLPTNETLYASKEILAFRRFNQTFDLLVENINGSTYLNDIFLQYVINVLPGPLAFDPSTQHAFFIAKNELIPTTLRYVDVDLNLRTFSFINSPLATTPFEVYFDGNTIRAIVIKNGNYSVSPLLIVPNLQNIGPVNNSIVLVDSLNNNFIYIQNTPSFVCLINCTNWIPVYQSSSSSSSSFSSQSSIYISTYESISSMQSSTSTASVFSSQSSSSESTESITSKSPIVFDNMLYVPNLKTPTIIPGTFVIPPNSILQLDVSGLDLQEGDTIPLFEFSSSLGEFSDLQLQSTSCKELHGELENTGTGINLVIIASNSVCAASFQLAIDGLPVKLYL